MNELKSLKASLSGQGIESENEVKLLKELLSSGNAILFTGAGFSKDCINIKGGTPPIASVLSKNIGKAIVDELGDSLSESDSNEIKSSQDLMFTSDFYISNIDDKTKLVELLKNNYTINEPTSSQVKICSVKWRRIYTTNYDNAIELALAKASKTVTSLDLTDPPHTYRDANDICLHINGKLDRLSAADLESKVKLSTSSYLSPEQFLNSVWYNQFKRDIEHCAAIIFVGYSMYDIDVKKILFNNQHLSEKTFFITKTDASFQDVYNLKTYGHVLKIGTDAFSDIAASCVEASNYEDRLEMVFSLEKHEVNQREHTIRDAEISDFLLYGKIGNDYINQVLHSNDYKNKIIYRTSFETISRHINEGNNVLILSELGNGKSLVVKLLMSKFTSLGYDCFIHLKNTYDIMKDVEVIHKNKRKTIIFIDDYSSVIDDVISLIESDYSNIQIVITTRHYGYENTKHKLQKLNLSRFKSHIIDNMTIDEVDQFVEMVHNLGSWGEKAGLPNSQKLKDTDINGHYQLSMLLISILQSPFIKAKIDEIANSIFKNKKYKDTVFTMLLLDVLGQHSDRAIISELSRNEEIYSTKFIENDGVSSIFRVDRGIIKSKSSTFSIFMLNNNFEPAYVATKLLDIVSYLDSLPDNNKEESYDQMKKSLLRFSMVERILPKRMTEIKFYYEKLKEKLVWLTNDPHYWVQYAMAMIPFKQYVPAQDFIDTAYSIALNKNNSYHTNNIDTQQARLHLLKCLDASPKDAFKLFKDADDLLKGVPNDFYKYRQVNRYDEVFQKKYSHFNRGDKVYFEQACKRIANEAKQALESTLDLNNDEIVIRRSKDVIERIITTINSQR